MPSPRTSREQSSSLLDAVFERLEESGSADGSSSVFRAEALASLNVPEEIDNRLRLVSRRTWLALSGVAFVVVASAIAAAVVPIHRTVAGTGRVVEVPGVVGLEAVESGRLELVLPSGTAVRSGDEVARLVNPTGASVSVRADRDGRIWQEFAAVGEFVQAGALIATLLPDGDGTTVLVAVPEAEAAGVRSGMKVTVTAGSKMVSGGVESIGPPLPSSAVSSRLALAVDSSSQFIVLVIRVDQPLVSGELVSVLVTTSRSTVVRSVLHAQA